MPCEQAVLNSFHYLITKFTSNDNIESNSSGLSIEFRNLSNIILNAKNNSKSEKCLIFIDGIIKSTVFEENIALSMSFIEFLMLQSNSLMFIASSERELIKLSGFYRNIKAMEISGKHVISKINEKIYDFSNLFRLIEKFDPLKRFLEIMKKQNPQKGVLANFNFKVEENKYFNNLNDCAKQFFFLISRSNKQRIKEDIQNLIMDYFKF